MSEKTALLVYLDRSIRRRLAETAAERRVSQNSLVCMLLEQGLARLAVEGVSQAADTLTAESQLLCWVEAEVKSIKTTGNWDEHIVRDIFYKIEEDALDLYEGAISNGAKVRVNSAIGGAIRRGLGADVLTKNGRRVVGNPPRPRRTLIQSYTLLTKFDP